MQVASNPFAFRKTFLQPRLHACRNLPEAKPVKRPEQKREDDATQQSKRYGLVVSRQNSEAHCRTSLIPYPVVVAGDNVKSIGARSKITVESLTPALWVLPIGIAAFQLVAKSDFLRNRQAQGGVVNFKVPRQGREA